MGQIVKRKKKGRPPKADLARRGLSPAAVEPGRRRSSRRRNVRYDSFIDYDEFEDFIEEEEEEDEEEERRKEKKMRLLLKLNSSKKGAREAHAGDERVARSSDEEEEDEESERKPLKKRRINGGGGGGDDSEAESENDDVDDDHDQEERGRKAETNDVTDNKGQDSVPGTPIDHQHHPNGLPLPEKKSLELILDKLQKKDTYGVYAEPVDLEELPDYLDVIDHPMDFATVRKKLANGSYSTLEQFESDVLLICSNAMQYNAPETIYHKQARAIQELAKKKFEKVRISIERSEKELKSEQKIKSNSLAKKPMKKPLIRTMQEPVGSDFSSGATLATAGEVQNGSAATQAGGCEKPNSNTDGLAEGNILLVDNNQEKAEDLSSGKGLASKFGRKPSMVDDNRRATYNMPNQPVARSESIFTTFEAEIKQLVPVGLDAQYFYARSLARFAATLGPVAWKVASQRIEQSVPPGCKFGRGWVGEYEPLPTPVLMIETCTQKESTLFTKLQCTADARKGDASSKAAFPAKGLPIKVSTSEARPSLFRPTSGPVLDGKPSSAPISTKDHSVKGPTSEAKSSLFRPNSGPVFDGKTSSASCAVTKASAPMKPTYQLQDLPPRTSTETQNKTSKQVELNLPPSSYQHDADIVAEKKLPTNTEIPAAKPRESSRTVGVTHSIPSKLPENNGVASRGLSNGKVVNSSLNGRIVNSSADNVPNQMARAASYYPQGQEQGLGDPVEVMKLSAEKSNKLQKPSNQSSADTPPVRPSVPSVTKDSSNAAVAAARAWMSIGAGGFRLPTENSTVPISQISAESLYNPTRQLHLQFPRVQGQFHLPAGMQFQPDKSNFPFQAFMRPACAGNEGQFQNRPMVFPQFVAADLSRFQMQSPWQGISPHSQPKQKQETLPPDLNIGFQSPGSPVKQSSGVMVDSPQPDLALQL